MFKVLVALCSLFFLPTSALCVGKTSVITLQFPVGAENGGLGETGVSTADNVFSTFWNPANLPAFGESNSLQIVHGEFYESLLPAFGIDDLWHTDTIDAIFLSNVANHMDFGFARHVNYINFGEIPLMGEYSEVLDTVRSSETVEVYALGMRYYDMISVGIAIKNIDSQLAPGYSADGDGTAEAQVLDFGLRLEKAISIAEVLNVHPAFGFAIHSFPQDSVVYIRSDTNSIGSNADPLPMTRWYGGSIEVSLLGLLGLVYVSEVEYSIVEREFIDREGYKINISPFYSVLRGKMDDPAGSRFEEYRGHVFRFNYLNTIDVIARTVAIFDQSLSTRIAEASNILSDYHLRPNIYLQHAVSEIFEQHEGSSIARVGQKREETSLGVSIVGDIQSLSFRDIFKRQKPVEDNEPLPESVIEVKDGAVVE